MPKKPRKQLPLYSDLQSVGGVTVKLDDAVTRALAIFNSLGVPVVIYAEAPSVGGTYQTVATGRVRPASKAGWKQLVYAAPAAVRDHLSTLAARPEENEADGPGV